MSVNRYTTESGLQTLANGQRCWIGTKAAYEAAVQAGTMENDILVAITDDDDDYKTDTVAENDNRVVTSGGVYNVLHPDLDYAHATNITPTTTVKTFDNDGVICLVDVYFSAFPSGSKPYYQFTISGVTFTMNALEINTRLGLMTLPVKKGDTYSYYISGGTMGQNIWRLIPYAN